MNSKLSSTTLKLLEEHRKTDRDSPTYWELNKTVKRAIRKDMREYNTQLIQETIKDNMNMKVLRTKRSRERTFIYKIKNGLEETVTETEGIAGIVQNFYQRLYSQQPLVSDMVPRTVLNVGSEEILEIQASELRAILKQMGNGKAPREDRVTSEMLKSGREILERALLTV